MFSIVGLWSQLNRTNEVKDIVVNDRNDGSLSPTRKAKPETEKPEQFPFLQGHALLLLVQSLPEHRGPTTAKRIGQMSCF